MAEENKKNEANTGGGSTGTPESLEQTLDNTQVFLDKNKGMINKVLIALIVVLGGYIVMKKMVWEPADVESQEALWEAQYVFERDSFASAIDLFEEITEDYGSTSASNVANLYLGISLMKQNQFDEAIDALDNYSGSGYFMPAIGTGLLADCYSETNEVDKAVTLYKKAAKEADSKVYSPYFLKKAGLLLEQNDDSESAVKLYQIILDKYYYEDIREFANERREIVRNLARAKTAS
ncbi:MAG: tetratricopeptide (TPR) repeat protein [Saprospiraceae bacterium]|jgi:tetratricopeptide (TPR) repeat protein